MAYLAPIAKSRAIIAPSNASSQCPSVPSMAPPKRKQPLDRMALSPMKRTEGRIAGPSSKKEPGTASTNKVKTGRITKNTNTPVAKAQAKKRKSFFWNLPILSSLFSPRQNNKQVGDLDGDTYVEDEDKGVKATPPQDTEYTMVVEDYDEDIKDAGCTLTANKEKTPRRDDPAFKDWSTEEIWMFNKLANRGLEPLMKESWTFDFPSFPDYLFTRDPKKAFIDNIHTSDYHGKPLDAPYKSPRLNPPPSLLSTHQPHRRRSPLPRPLKQ